MLISCCGNRCDRCEQYPEQCPGCEAIGGRVPWAAALEVEVCPFVACARDTGVPHCGRCREFPCELYDLTLRRTPPGRRRPPLPGVGRRTSGGWTQLSRKKGTNKPALPALIF